MRGFRESYAGLSKRNLHCSLCHVRAHYLLREVEGLGLDESRGSMTSKIFTAFFDMSERSLPFSRGGGSLIWRSSVG